MIYLTYWKNQNIQTFKMLYFTQQNNQKYFFLSPETSEIQIYPISLGEKLPLPVSETPTEKRYKKRFVKWAAHKGLLNNLLTPHELTAAIKGVLPKRFNIHHYIPKFLGGTDDFDNLCVIDKTLHDALHQNMWDEVERHCVIGRRQYIALPPRRVVLTAADYGLFFSPEEIEKFSRQAAAKAQIATRRRQRTDCRRNNRNGRGRC